MGKLNLVGGTLILDGGRVPPRPPYNLSTGCASTLETPTLKILYFYEQWKYINNGNVLPENCEQPVAPANGFVQPNMDIWFNGNTAEYSCMDGYVLEGTSAVTCRGLGSFNNNAPTCQGAICGKHALLYVWWFVDNKRCRFFISFYCALQKFDRQV